MSLYAEDACTYKALVCPRCFVDIKDNYEGNRESREIDLIRMDVRDERRA